MRKQAPDVEWHVVESDADWERRSILLLPEIVLVSNRHLPLKHYLWRMAALLPLLTSVGGGLWRTDQVSLPPLTADGTTIAQEERWTVVYNDNGSPISGSGDLSSKGWQHECAPHVIV
jgi:hypothetical protein